MISRPHRLSRLSMHYKTTLPISINAFVIIKPFKVGKSLQKEKMFQKIIYLGRYCMCLEYYKSTSAQKYIRKYHQI